MSDNAARKAEAEAVGRAMVAKLNQGRERPLQESIGPLPLPPKPRDERAASPAPLAAVPHGMVMEVKQVFEEGAQQAGPSSTKKQRCGACGQEGHARSDTKCPKHQEYEVRRAPRQAGDRPSIEEERAEGVELIHQGEGPDRATEK
jgi:hypothetical protein